MELTTWDVACAALVLILDEELAPDSAIERAILGTNFTPKRISEELSNVIVAYDECADEPMFQSPELFGREVAGMELLALCGGETYEDAEAWLRQIERTWIEFYARMPQTQDLREALTLFSKSFYATVQKELPPPAWALNTLGDA